MNTSEVIKNRVPAREATKGMNHIDTLRYLLSDAKLALLVVDEITADYKRILHIEDKESINEA